MRMVIVWCLAMRTNLQLVGQWCTVRAPPFIHRPRAWLGIPHVASCLRPCLESLCDLPFGDSDISVIVPRRSD